MIRPAFVLGHSTQGAAEKYANDDSVVATNHWIALAGV